MPTERAALETAQLREGGLRERHKLARRTRILEAARELLRERPDDPLTAERIAERAEVAPATVYNLVGPRDKIWQALAASFLGELEQRLAEAHTRDAIGRAQEVVAQTVDLFIENASVSRRILIEWEQSGLVLSRGPLSHLRHALADAQRTGLLRTDIDVATLAGVVASASVGVTHQWIAGQIDEQQFAAQALLALDVALAAAAVDQQRSHFLSRLNSHRTVRPTTRQTT
ncbi:TetR/AcrR family transcriptional regulator [Kribbella sp. NBC_01245]|uniref:TetR/AcrR family transcriptional regulator n=1 Tax=Kribbella sp. NBC_01245 TaxID=2903578 RepID=UPI002E29CE08|nr:TetR/AcrR family transcriptional regulator [Kribbella sp. NBC_01245]